MIHTIKAVSNYSGVCMQDVRKGMQIMETDDPCLGAGYMIADGWAVAVKYDRVAFNKARAEGNAERIRSFLDRSV